MTCARYGVAVTFIHRGKVRDTKLVISPMSGEKNLVCAGDLDYARSLCERMRAAEAKYGIPTAAYAYTIVPLPVTPELVTTITEIRW